MRRKQQWFGFRFQSSSLLLSLFIEREDRGRATSYVQFLVWLVTEPVDPRKEQIGVEVEDRGAGPDGSLYQIVAEGVRGPVEDGGLRTVSNCAFRAAIRVLVQGAELSSEETIKGRKKLSSEDKREEGTPARGPNLSRTASKQGFGAVLINRPMREGLL